MASCIFCRIIKGEIPCFKLFESERTLAFMDINPLSRGHAVCEAMFDPCRPLATSLTRLPQLVIPKYHGAKLGDIPDEHLSEILPVVKKLAAAAEASDYNLLQNNGTIAHQQVHHVHFHMIPKPNVEEGLGIAWPSQETDMDKLKVLFEDLKAKMT